MFAAHLSAHLSASQCSYPVLELHASLFYGHAVRSALAAAEEAYANSGVIFDEGDGAGDGSCAESADQHENASDTLISSALDMLRHKV